MAASTAADPGEGPGTRGVVELAGLSKDYGGFRAVDDLSLQVHGGEILAMLGPNGAGKTTTIRMLMGILVPSRGTARIVGRDCFRERAEVMRHTGYLPDEPVFYDHLRGDEIVRFCGRMRGMADRDVTAAMERLAERLDLAAALGEYAVNYSMGMRKKLGLCLAMLHEPDLLVLDEPTNGLDPLATRALLDLIREAAAGGTAVLYSTHLLEQADRLCHRVAIVHEGRLAALGTPTSLRAGLAPGASLEDVFFQVARREPAPESGSAG